MPPSTLHRASLALVLPLLAACSEGAEPLSPPPVDAAPEPLAELLCTADLTVPSLACGAPADGGASSSLIVGGQDVYVRLTSSNLVRANDTLAVDVTVQNLIPQPLGTTDGTVLDPAGVRVFFQSGPTVTEGTGSVSVANPDGMGTFTASGQPFFQWDEVLDTNEVSAARNWKLAVDAGVTKFVFTVFVAAEVPFPDGYVELTPAATQMEDDSVQTVVATVRTAVGNPVPGAVVTWQSSDPSVATVDAAGNVTAVAPGIATISATSDVRSGSVRIGVCADLAVGEVFTTSLDAASELCFSGGATGTELTYVPVNLSTAGALSLTVTGTGIDTVPSVRAVSPSLVVGRGPALDADAGSAGAEWHVESLERQARETERLLGDPAARVGRDGGARYLIVPGVPSVGDLWDLNVAEGCSGTLDTRTGRVVSVGTHVIVVADTMNPAGGFTTAQYDSIALEFDSIAYPVVVDNFGAPTDLDGNGRVVAFYTRAVNEQTPPGSSAITAGYFNSRDLFSSAPDSCNLSNEGEIFYMMVPDPTGVVNGNVRTVSSVRSGTVKTMGHEMQHLVNAARRIYINGTTSFEEVWLNEGLSHVVEELMFYRTSVGLAPRSNIELSDLTTGPNASRRVAAFNTYANQNFSRLRSWLQRPDTAGAFRANDVLATRGAIWAFLRYAADRRNGTDSNLWFALANSTTSGKSNLQAVLGVDPDEWLRDFTAATYADDAVTGVDAVYTTSSWNYRSVYSGLGGFPLGARRLFGGTPTTLAYSAGGGAAYLRFAVPASTFGTVTADAGTASDALIVMRTR